MARALLYLPEPAGRSLAARSVAGRSLTVRALVSAFRAGATLVVIPEALRDTAVDRALGRMPALAAAVRWLDPDRPDTPPADGEPWLFVPVSAVVDAVSLRALLTPEPPAQGAALSGSAAASAPVVLAPANLAARLWKDAAACRPLGPELAHHIAQAGLESREAPGVFAAVKDEAGLRRAENALYRRVGIDADSGVDRLLHRRCSHWITRALVRTPVTPNQVSLLSFLIGCGSIWCFWDASPVSAVWGLVLYTLACVVDHSDGELARLTFQESRFGAHLDWAIDNIIHAGVVFGIGLSAGGPVAIAIAIVAAVGVALSAWFARILPHEIEVGEAVGGALKDMGNRDLFYLLLLGFVLFRWTAPLLLLPLAVVVAVGSQAYWIGCVDRIRRSRAGGGS
ncbi:MAG TPA: CDP-alcohol phosphatidyltransferase family protein [Methylomirabilota bacterium]|nr:CDP-alcohol phosphatidyltransferase family protein [Methylomirabilota bacterium]